MLTIGSLFSGIGAFEKALENLNIEHEVKFFCEIDRYAAKSYSLIHNIDASLNLGDITKVDKDTLPYVDMLTWGFPCQDISIAGKQKGIKEGTRSGLYKEGYETLKAIRPKYSIIENVKNLTSKKFRPDFIRILSEIEALGYNNYIPPGNNHILNAKDYGIPQNRERVFIISIRKDIDPYADSLIGFPWPLPFDNGLRLKDLLEQEVDEKYYISRDKTEKLIMNIKDKEISNSVRVGGHGSVDRHQWDMVPILKDHDLLKSQDGISNCIDANYFKGLDNHAQRTGVMTVKQEPSILRYERTEYGKEIRKQYENGEISEKRDNMRELKPRTDGLANTLSTVQKDNLLAEVTSFPLKFLGRNQRNLPSDYAMCVDTSQTNGVMVKQATKLGYDIAKEGDSIDIQRPTSTTRRGRVGKGVAQCLDTACSQVVLEKGENELIPLGSIDESGKNAQAHRVYDSEGLACTQVGLAGGVGAKTGLYVTDYRIRRLTPLECFRLMAFDDADAIMLKEAGISDSQLYKCAGNSICVNVLEQIFKVLLHGC